MSEENEGGFELEGQFYPWRFGMTTGKDLMLIDRLTGLTLQDFLQAIDEGQIPITFRLVMVATSLRHANPDWSVQRIVRLVESMDFEQDYVEVVGDEEEEQQVPPTQEPAGEMPTAVLSKSAPNGSSSPSTPQDGSSSETSSGIPV